MKYCINCGSPVTDEDLYCPYCGTRIYEKTNNTQNTNVHTSTNPHSSTNSANNDDPFASLDNNGTTTNTNSSKNDNAKHSEKSEPTPDYNERASTITKVLSFFSPIVGLILYVYWCRDYKVKAYEVGVIAIIGYVVSIVVGFIFGLVCRSIYGITGIIPQIVGLIG